MAKKKKTTPTKSEEPKRFPDVGPNELTFVMTHEEVYSLSQILSFSRDIFKQMSLNCGTEGDAKAEAVYALRSEQSDILYTKVKLIASIGEPTSRVSH